MSQQYVARTEVEDRRRPTAIDVAASTREAIGWQSLTRYTDLPHKDILMSDTEKEPKPQRAGLGVRSLLTPRAKPGLSRLNCL